MRYRLLTLLVLISASPVRAGWQQTAWGMSPHEAAIAMHGAIPESVGTSGLHKIGLVVGNVGKYVVAQRRFDVAFYYANGGLYDVTLYLDNASECQFLVEDLTRVYGKPKEDYEIAFIAHLSIWENKAKDNNITLTKQFPGCSLMYRPLSNGL